MSKITKHPVLEVPVREKVIFKYNGQEVEGEKGYTIAGSLTSCRVPVHSHSLDGRTAHWNVVLESVGHVKCW